MAHALVGALEQGRTDWLGHWNRAGSAHSSTFWHMPPERSTLAKPSVQWSRMLSERSIWAQPAFKRSELPQVPTLLPLEGDAALRV